MGKFGRGKQLSTLHPHRLCKSAWKALPSLAPGESVVVSQTNTGLETIAAIQFPKKAYFSGDSPTDINIMISNFL